MRELDLSNYHVRDQLRLDLCGLQGNRCLYCHSEISPALASIDHIIPRHRGGRSIRPNLAAVCQDCNEAKTNLTLDEFMPEITAERVEAGRREQQRQARRPHRFTPLSGLAFLMARDGKLPVATKPVPEPTRTPPSRGKKTFIVERTGRRGVTLRPYVAVSRKL